MQCNLGWPCATSFYYNYIYKILKCGKYEVSFVALTKYRSFLLLGLSSNFERDPRVTAALRCGIPAHVPF